jgi:outer membrane lipoprotein-sorting protein
MPVNGKCFLAATMTTAIEELGRGKMSRENAITFDHIPLYKEGAVNRLSEVKMTSAHLAALVGALLIAAPLAAAQGVPLPHPAPKSRNQAARSQSPMPSDTAGRPIPIPPPESVPYDGSQRALVDRASNYLSSLQSLTGDFVQIGPDGGRSVGKFYLQKPGRVRFEYDPPSPIDVIADGYQVIVRDRNLATQDLYPLSQTPLRYLLADQIDLARDTKIAAVSQDNTFITVKIEERQLLIGTSRLVLMFSAKDMQLREWTVTDPQGYETMVAVYNLDASRKPDPGLFTINYYQRGQ